MGLHSLLYLLHHLFKIIIRDQKIMDNIFLQTLLIYQYGIYNFQGKKYSSKKFLLPQSYPLVMLHYFLWFIHFVENFIQKLPKINIYNLQIIEQLMIQYKNLNEGTFLLQPGFRNDTAIISCPYIAHKIQVFDAPSLKILNGAQVYWTQFRRFYASGKKGGKQIIQAVIVGIKHCPYFYQGKNVLCTIKVKSTQEGICIEGAPIDSKLPKFDVIDYSILQNLNLSTKQSQKILEQNYYWVRFLYWNYEDVKPKACLTNVFQGYKTPQTQTEAILWNLQISQSKVQIVNQNQYFNPLQQYLPVKNHKKFDSIVFTIDPPTSIDIQDALSVQTLSPGLYEVGIHISDVTSYKNHFNRQEILERGTSIYLPHKTIHMMPQKIIQLCALKSKKNRLAFSVFIKITESGQILSTRFQKTIVMSAAQLNYQEAQMMIDDTLINKKQFADQKKINMRTLNQIIKKIKLLRKIAFNKRATRTNADIFDRNQITFKLDKKNYPINIGRKKRIDSERLVEQFMIMANYQVAKKLVKQFGENSLLIYHPKPSTCNIEHLNDMASDYGFRFKAQSIEKLQRQMNELFSKEGIKDELKQLFLVKAIQIQEFAVYKRYLNTFKGHYGLNLQCYTHFTSPVRRFADLMVHQQLQKCLNRESLSLNDIETLSEQIDIINKARIRGKKLKQKVNQCFINLYLYKKQQKVKTKGFIISLGLKSASLYVPLYNIIKEVLWEGKAEYADKDTIQVNFFKQSQINGIQKWEFQKNDSVDIQVESQYHQEVKVKILVGEKMLQLNKINNQ